jgi:gentisate 1,2-dioxygenase
MATQAEHITGQRVSSGQGHEENGHGAKIDSVERLLDELTTTNTKPLWAEMARYNPPLPNPKSIPFIWRYEDVRPYLIRAGKLVPEKQAERRVLMLVNPALGIYNADTRFTS